MSEVTKDRLRHARDNLTEALREQHRHYQDFNYTGDQALDRQVERQDAVTAVNAAAEHIKNRIQAHLAADAKPAQPSEHEQKSTPWCQ